MLTKEEFISRAEKIHGKKYYYDKVVIHRLIDKVEIICPTHGEFFQSPKTHLQGCGCPKCKQSKLEREIMNFLDEYKIHYIYQAGKNILPWIGKQYLDFYLPDYKIAIECQGLQHFMPCNFGSKTVSETDNFKLVQERDENKRNLCNKNNIRILYYTSKDINDKIDTNNKCLTDKQKILTIIKERE